MYRLLGFQIEKLATGRFRSADAEVGYGLIPDRNTLTPASLQCRPIFRRIAELCKPNIPPFSPWLTLVVQTTYLLAGWDKPN